MLFHVVNLGCKVNKVESDSYAAQCLSAGLAEGTLEAADLIVVNTCAVTGEAEKKTFCSASCRYLSGDVAPHRRFRESVYRGVSERLASK